MEIATRNLLQAVDKERESRRMSDRKFSTAVLGISPAYFCLLKAGKRPVTGNLAVLLLQKLPDLAPEIAGFVMRQGNNGNNTKTGAKTEGGGAGLGQLSTPTIGKGRKT